MAGFFVRLEMSNQISPAGEGLMAECGDAAEMAEHRVADRSGGGGKVGFIESALQEGARGQDNVVRAGAQGA